jgi:hypothetical protein
MELVNTTRLATAYTVALDPDGREYLVVAVKGTFDIPFGSDAAVRLSENQVPVLLADELGGDSGALPLFDADLCLRKAKCDVILNCAAYAPGGKPTDRVQVGVRVGGWQKAFTVVGNRLWKSTGPTARPSRPEPFDVMPITYERAFGGVEQDPKHPNESRTYARNPLGRGYRARRDVDGIPLPNTEESGEPVTDPGGEYPPMSFGPLGRNWFPRYTFAGTYDQYWRDHVFPFLPKDFSDRYHQSAPDDQQIPYPTGGEDVALLNLSPEGLQTFQLPRAEASITVAPRHRDRHQIPMTLDTITFQPSEKRFSLCWRATCPLRRSIFEIDEVVVGAVSQKFLRDRDGLPLPFPLHVR